MEDFSHGRLGADRWWTLMVDRRNRTLDLGRWVLVVGFRNPLLEGDADETVDRCLAWTAAGGPIRHDDDGGDGSPEKTTTTALKKMTAWTS
ncbi:hypothetical protein ACLOJK_041063 [Asimina triloba]